MSPPTSIQTPDDVRLALDDLIRRVNKLESDHFVLPDDVAAADEQLWRARYDVERKKCFGAVWKWVPPNYYDLDLNQRAKLLGASSTKQLCKAVLMENRAHDPKRARSPRCGDGAAVVDPTYARFYLVVVQYTAKMSTSKLELAVRTLRSMGGGDRLGPEKFEFRVASEEDNLIRTGYEHNSVAPFGLVDPGIPVLLPVSIVEELGSLGSPFMFMGGGHVHLKLGMAVGEFVRATGAIVVDVSDPR